MAGLKEKSKNEGKSAGAVRDVKTSVCGEEDLPNAENVRYSLRDSRTLTLLVKLYERDRLTQIAKASGAAVGDLPLQLNLSVWALNKMSVVKAGQVSSELCGELLEVGKNTMWMLSGRVLKIVMDLSGGPAFSQRTEPGRYLPLASMKQVTKLGESNYRVVADLRCRGGGQWPVLDSPAVASSVSRGSSPTSIVPRALRFSVSPIATREASATVERSSLKQLNEFATLDTSQLPVVRLCLTMDRKRHGVVRFVEEPTICGIGFDVDARWLSNEERVHEADRHPGSAVNVVAFVERDADGRECISIELDSSRDCGMVGGDERVIGAASRLRVGNHYLLNFTATRLSPPPPDFAQVYESVRDHLLQLPNALNNLNMPSVRVAVVRDLSQRVVTRELKNMIWEAVRLYVIRDFMAGGQQSLSASPLISRAT